MDKFLPRAIIIFGLLLAIGMSSAAFILGVQARKATSGQQTITVKGLAEKPIKADMVEWTVTLSVNAPTFTQALDRMRKERPALNTFLTGHGLDKANWQEGSESVVPHYDEVPLPNSNGFRQVQNGFDASQNVVITTKDLAKVVAANKDFLRIQAEGRPFSNSPPSYLVSGLEDVKMSLIGAATENARKRGEEFVKRDGVKVGVMRSASQGAFYILAAGGNNDTNDYGGVYDKTTIDKLARVVVTIVYNIEQ